MLRSYRNLPPIQTGYPLDDVWSVVVPIARTNLITNPSFETNTTSWTAIGGSIARSTTQQYHGAYSLAVTPTATTTDGVRYDTVSLTSGTNYAYSAKVRGVAGLKYSLGIETTGSVALATTTFTATGRWQWISGYYAETSSTTRRLVARKAGTNASTAIFYIDGAQVEAIVAGELVSTYIDGDQLGLVPNQTPAVYYWNGTPHASTSARSGLTRAGGMVLPFKKYGFLLTMMVGLGLAQPQNVATDYARIDGGFDNYTRKPARQFTLTGRFQGRTYGELRKNRSALAQLFDRDLISQDQQLTLLRHVEDGYGRILTSETRHIAKYESGFGGNTDNQAAETVPITFTSYLPLIGSDGESGAALSVQTAVGTAARIIQRSTAGVWSLFGVGADSNVFDVVFGLDGKMYVAGDFTTIAGVAMAGIGYYDGTWHAMGSGAAGGSPSVLARGPDGSIYAGGTFTSMGGVATTNFVARWNGSAWVSIGSANGTTIAAMVAGPDGKIYAGGDFTTIGGVAANRIAYWNGAAWVAMGTGAASPVTEITVGPDGFAYMAVLASNVYKWNGTVWTSIGAIDNQVDTLTFGLNGILYAGGSFTTIGGVTASRIAQWNGVAWSTLGTGVTNAGGTQRVRDIMVEPNGVLVVVGTFDTAGGITTINNIVRWNGSAFVYYDMDVNWSTVFVATRGPDGTVVFGGASSAAATSAALTTITNPGTARAYPIVRIVGPSSGTARIYNIANATNGRTIYLNYTINAGETATLVFQPDNLSFTSDYQGNIANKILSGSDTADFFLQPGANSISFFSASTTVTATIYFRSQYTSLDDVQ